jgi:hypothetical protein
MYDSISEVEWHFGVIFIVGGVVVRFSWNWRNCHEDELVYLVFI